MAFGRQAGAVLVRLCADRIVLAEANPGKAGGLQASCSVDWAGPAFWAPTDGLVEKMPDGSAEALAEAVAQAGFASRSVWLLIPDRLAKFKSVRLPYMKQRDWQEGVRDAGFWQTVEGSSDLAETHRITACHLASNKRADETVLLRASLTDSSGPSQHSRQHQIALQLDKTRLAGRPHASSLALQFEAQHPVSATSRALISLSLRQRELHRPRAAGDKDRGLATSWLGRLVKNLSGGASGWLVEAGLGGSRLAAADRPQDRQGVFGQLRVRHSLAGGVLGLGLETGRQSWAAPHPAYQLAAKRRDRHQSLRLALQGELTSGPQPPILLLSASSSKNQANILNFSHVENRLSLRLSVPFWAR